MRQLKSAYCEAAIPHLKAVGARWDAAKKVWLMTEEQSDALYAAVGRCRNTSGADKRAFVRWYDADSTVFVESAPVTMRTVTRDDLDGGDEDGNTAGQYVGARIYA
jgi:hypothetical protein